MNSPVDKIKEHLSIIDVISTYLSLEPSGKNFKARCPFHNEKTPSFFISSDRNSYYCFGCGAKGDIFSFVEKFEGTDFRGALKLLAQKAGIALDYKPNDTEDKKELWYEILEEATLFFEHSYNTTPEARAYLLSRGLTDQTISSFRIGYAPGGWRALSDYLLKKGYLKEDIEIIGLIKTANEGFYDRFRSRIMFPIPDSSGRVIAFSGRIFGTDETKEAKYINSPDTPLFNKSNVLYGIDKAKSAIRTRGYSILVEGQMDLILSHQVGFTNTIAVSGTALTDSLVTHSDATTEIKINNFGLIRRLSPNIILAFDGDEAGTRAINRSAAIALSLEMQVKILALPSGKDPADIIAEDPTQWKERIKQAVNIIGFHLGRICENSNDMRIRGKKIREIIFPFLSMIKSAIERSAYIVDIVQKTGLPERAVVEDFEMYQRTAVPQATLPLPQATLLEDTYSRKEYLERRLFGIIFWQQNKKEIVSLLDSYIEGFKNDIGEAMYEELYQSYVPYSEPLALEAEMWYGSKTDTLKRDVQEIVLNLEEEILLDRKNKLHPLNTEEKIKEFTILSKRIEHIKHKRIL